MWAGSIRNLSDLTVLPIAASAFPSSALMRLLEFLVSQENYRNKLFFLLFPSFSLLSYVFQLHSLCNVLNSNLILSILYFPPFNSVSITEVCSSVYGLKIDDTSHFYQRWNLIILTSWTALACYPITSARMCFAVGKQGKREYLACTLYKAGT